MRRIFSDYAYGPEPRNGCWWDETIAAPDWPQLSGEISADVAIIGGGFTGMSAALHLAEAGVKVALLEAETPGWGASGRNGGFCCLGGAKLSGAAMQRKYGEEATQTYAAGEMAAIDLVRGLLDRHGIDADTHSKGETRMAHSPRAMTALRREAELIAAHGGAVQLLEQPELAEHGLNGQFFGALTTPAGFGLNPRKYLFGISEAAQRAGATLYQKSPVTNLTSAPNGHVLTTPQGSLQAKQVIIATNGYSWDGLPDWLSGRYIPAQSTVMVTRPLSDAELQTQGWFSDQMAYDTRNLLHYFRLMPDRRFLFGMRGGLFASPRAEAGIRQALRKHFEDLFPAWRDVEATHVWSGMVSMARNLVPFVGPVPGAPGLFAGLCYHGNGVAMGSYAGRLLSDLVQGQQPALPYSPVMQSMGKFPLGRARRALMLPAYAILGLMD
ncbi:FAD-dependent oxidoreductase [Phaeobacter sp. PT47_59]|uniref:NAD(P)/FAD-dependent oxidoreductase n=1 Tax=Phaeobacter sp. PT47_59 TaxID=3029979 RepID=UPI0023805976|nr:FAD-dependent oxidoreductase [Phaeobacter sp. PT47_59]MDE4172967.1 FAD-dependent oxidoreductase [Phaeobacter sp. PT47_59]